jgi:hypothetical protein
MRAAVVLDRASHKKMMMLRTLRKDQSTVATRVEGTISEIPDFRRCNPWFHKGRSSDLG